jgi:hypothetical protein
MPLYCFSCLDLIQGLPVDHMLELDENVDSLPNPGDQDSIMLRSIFDLIGSSIILP